MVHYGKFGPTEKMLKQKEGEERAQKGTRKKDEDANEKILTKKITMRVLVRLLVNEIFSLNF